MLSSTAMYLLFSVATLAAVVVLGRWLSNRHKNRVSAGPTCNFTPEQFIRLAYRAPVLPAPTPKRLSHRSATLLLPYRSH